MASTGNKSIVPFNVDKQSFIDWLNNYAVLSGYSIPTDSPLYQLHSYLYNLTALNSFNALPLVDIYNISNSTGTRLDNQAIIFHATRYKDKPSIILALLLDTTTPVTISSNDTFLVVDTDETYYSKTTQILDDTNPFIILTNKATGVCQTLIGMELQYDPDPTILFSLASVKYAGRAIETDDEFRTRLMTEETSSYESIFVQHVLNNTSLYDCKLAYNRTASELVVGDITMPSGSCAVILPIEDVFEEVGIVFYQDIIGYTTDNTVGDSAIIAKQYDVVINDQYTFTAPLPFQYYIAKTVYITITIKVMLGFDTPENIDRIKNLMLQYPFSINGTFTTIMASDYLTRNNINFATSDYINTSSDIIKANATEVFGFSTADDIIVKVTDGNIGG